VNLKGITIGNYNPYFCTFKDVKPGSLFCTNNNNPNPLKWIVYLKLFKEMVVYIEGEDDGVHAVVNAVILATGKCTKLDDALPVTEWRPI